MLPTLLTDTVSADPRRALDSALLWGFEAVVLRTVGKQRVPHVNEAQLRRLLEDAEMPLEAVDPGLFEGDATAPAAGLDDLEALAALAPFCTRMRTRTVIVGPMGAAPREVSQASGVLKRAGNVAAKHGLTLAVRNEGEAASAEALADLVGSIGHPSVVGWWSVAASREAGEEPLASAKALVGTPLAGIEADEAFAEAAPEASGLIPLRQAGFEGPVVLAFGGVPQKGLATATALIRHVRMARKAAA